jgi:hypothetical protein
MSDMPQHLILASEHHKQLIEEARRQREARLARQSMVERPMRGRGLRSHVGDLLINFGQRLKAGGTGEATRTSTESLWG